MRWQSPHRVYLLDKDKPEGSRIDLVEGFSTPKDAEAAVRLADCANRDGCSALAIVFVDSATQQIMDELNAKKDTSEA